MDDRTKSILLQVAFKEAAGSDTLEEVENKTVQFFELLVALHEKLGINPETKSGGGGGRKTSGKPAPVGESFIVDGEIYTDFRDAKSAPNSGLNKKYPDFKRESDGKGFWLYSQEGEPNEEVKPLVAAADGREFK
jgi:hypothetical protein